MMERLTMTSDKGGLAFTFDLDISCKQSEARKILALGERLKAYEDTELEPDEIKHLNKQLSGYVKQYLHCDEQLKTYRDLGTVEEFSELKDAYDKAQKSIALLKGVIDRQNNTIDYLNSMGTQGFNW